MGKGPKGRSPGLKNRGLMGRGTIMGQVTRGPRCGFWVDRPGSAGILY